jgi:hypothetical protein
VNTLYERTAESTHFCVQNRRNKLLIYLLLNLNLHGCDVIRTDVSWLHILLNVYGVQYNTTLKGVSLLTSFNIALDCPS